MISLVSLLAFAKPPHGFEAPGTEIFSSPCLVGSGTFCINRTIALMFLAALIVIALFLLAFRSPKLVPRGLQNLMESGVDFVRNSIAIEVIGHDGVVWVPFLSALFFFIFVGNIFGIIPGIQFPVNSRMAIPGFLAVLVWLLFNGVGVTRQGAGSYLKNTLFPPGVPKFLYALVTPIELVSVFIVRPLTLSVRLLANMIAGHLILTIFFLGTAYLLAKPITIPFAIPAFMLSVFLVGFEILVAVLQAYIFTILTAVYIAGAIHPEH